MVCFTKGFWEEKLKESCQREEEKTAKLYLKGDSPQVEKDAGYNLVWGGGQDEVQEESGEKTLDLTSQAKTLEKEVIIPVSLARVLLGPLVEMKEEEESVTKARSQDCTCNIEDCRHNNHSLNTELIGVFTKSGMKILLSDPTCSDVGVISS